MREEDSNWFAKWEEVLPSPQELIPLSQTLITPHLAQVFHIPPNPTTTTPHHHHQTPPQPNSSADFESSAGGDGGGGDDPARHLKRPRLVWTPQLHKRFVDAVAHLGIKNAVPKTIMQMMSVDGLTRENVASHLQKYRLYLKRMQGINSNNNNNNNTSIGNGDSAMDRLFASSPVPAHFLRQNSDHFIPYVPVAVAAMQQQHHHDHHHSPVAVSGGQQFRHFGNSRPSGQFEQHPFLVGRQQTYSDSEDVKSANGRKVLTLFPAGED